MPGSVRGLLGDWQSYRDDSRDSKYNRYILAAVRSSPPEHPVMHIEVGKLAPVRSRLRNPRVLPAPAAYALA